MSLRNTIILFITFTGLNHINGQIISINPAFPTINDVITVQYDATQGNGGLVGISPVYAHTGVVTQSGLPSSWSYVQILLILKSYKKMNESKYYKPPS